MRTLPILLVLAACGTPPASSDNAPESVGTEAAAAVDVQPTATPAPAADGAVTCDAFADHMMKSVEKTALESDILTPAQALEFGTAMVEGLRSGCKDNDRLAEFKPQVQCYMDGEDDTAWEACRTAEGGAAFNEYVTSLLASTIRLNVGAPE